MEAKMDILQAILEGAARPTHIRCRSKLTWEAYQNVITGLEEMGLVSLAEVEDRKVYALTQKGIKVLDEYANVRRQFVSLQLVAPLA
jgi:predicted transcriptional regulator